LQIITVSIAFVNPQQGHGASTWVIWATQTLWSGEGHALAPSQENYSELADEYGVYMAMSFLK